jgi:hypothetical protein
MITNNAINVFPAGRNMAIGTDFGANPWQRGETFTSFGEAYTADMFSFRIVGSGQVEVNKIQDSPTASQANYFSTHCLDVTVTVADTLFGENEFYVLNYVMEGFDWSKLAQRPIVASFWVKSDVTGTFCISLNNSVGDRSVVQEYTINVADSWEKKIIKIPPSPVSGGWNYTNGLGIYFRWCLGSGINNQTSAGTWRSQQAFCTPNQVNFMQSNGNTFKINLFQLEAGYTATPFEEVHEAEVLKKSQRYYFKTYNVGTLPGTSTTSGAMSGYASVPTGQLLTSSLMQPIVSMRTSPSITGYSTTGASGNVRNITAGTNEAIVGFATSNESSLGYPVTVVDLIEDNRYGLHYVADASL